MAKYQIGTVGAREREREREKNRERDIEKRESHGSLY